MMTTNNKTKRNNLTEANGSLCLFLVGSGGGGEQGGQNLPPPVPCSPASSTFISRLTPFSVLLPAPCKSAESKHILII